ncbi:hypothetical protein KAI65_05565 [Candidatus Parcubacteria bacterium]|nr:hypothetical protein [Candidatus Parcubacteria bacterium]
MKKYLILIFIVVVLLGCSNKNIFPPNNNILTAITEESSSQPKIIFSDDNCKVYSFNSGINRLDLNFDKIDDYIFVSHINGADYYDYHTIADRDIFNFFIRNERDGNLQSYWNIVTREEVGKKIDKFDRDFVISELLGCNGGGTLRLVQTKKSETFLILIDKNTEEKDGSDIKARYNIYKLKKSGKISGSDYIFSFVKEIIGNSSGCGIETLGDKGIVDVVKEINL